MLSPFRPLNVVVSVKRTGTPLPGTRRGCRLVIVGAIPDFVGSDIRCRLIAGVEGVEQEYVASAVTKATRHSSGSFLSLRTYFGTTNPLHTPTVKNQEFAANFSL